MEFIFFLLAYPLKIDLGKDQKYKNPIIFATGAEDSLLRLFQCKLLSIYILMKKIRLLTLTLTFIDMPGEIENNLISLCSIKKHTSVIKGIEWSYGKLT